MKAVLTVFDMESCALMMDPNKEQSTIVIGDKLFTGTKRVQTAYDAVLQKERNEYNKRNISISLEDMRPTSHDQLVFEMEGGHQDTRPISYEQLAAKSKGIYAGLIWLKPNASAEMRNNQFVLRGMLQDGNL